MSGGAVSCGVDVAPSALFVYFWGVCCLSIRLTAWDLAVDVTSDPVYFLLLDVWTMCRLVAVWRFHSDAGGGSFMSPCDDTIISEISKTMWRRWRQKRTRNFRAPHCNLTWYPKPACLQFLLPRPLEVITKPAPSQNSVWGGGVVRKRYNGSLPKNMQTGMNFMSQLKPFLLNGYGTHVLNQMWEGWMWWRT